MNDLEKQVLRIIGENLDSPDVFSDITPIRRSINDAIQDLAAISNLYTRTYQLPLYADRQIYRLQPQNDYILHVISCYDRQNANFLEATSPGALAAEDPDWMQSTGRPTAFLNLGFHLLGIYRIPSSSGIVLELHCLCVPSQYTTDSALVKLSTTFKQCAVSYAVSEYYASRGDAVRATEHFGRYMDFGKFLPLQPLQADRPNRYTGGAMYAGRDLQ